MYTNYVSKKRVDPDLNNFRKLGFPVVEQRGFVPKITVTHSISSLSKIRVVFYPDVNSVLAAKGELNPKDFYRQSNLLTSEAYNDRNTREIKIHVYAKRQT